MTRKRRAVKESAPDVEEVFPPVVEDTSAGVADNDTLYEDMAEDSYSMLWRRDPVKMGLVYHGKLSPADSNAASIEAKFGGGEYHCREKRRSDNNGRYVWGRQRTIFIAGPYKDPALSPLLASGMPVVAPAKTAQEALDPKGPGGMNMEDVKMAGVISLLQMTQQAAASQATMQSQMQTMLMASMEAQRKGMEAVIAAASRRDETPRVDPMEMLTKTVELLKGVAGPKSDVKEMMDGMRSMMEFREELLPAPRSSGDVVMDSVPKMLELVGEGFALKRKEAEMAKGNPVTAPKALASGVPGAEGGGTAVPVWEQVVRSQERRIVQAASAGKSPEVMAAFAVEFMPDGVRGAMEEFLRREDALDALCTVLPSLRAYPHWVTHFLSAARLELLGEEAELEEEPTGEPGEASHADSSEGP